MRRRTRNQRRAQAFRTRDETQRRIRLIDKFGNIKHIIRNGKMAAGNVDTIMTAIDRRARRVVDAETLRELQREALIEEAIDETGTVGELPSAVEERFLREHFTRQELEEVRAIDDDLMKVHGRAPQSKREGVVRLLYENINGLNNRMSGNTKLDRGREMLDELEVDIAAFNEIKINFNHKKNINGLAQLFNGGESEVKVIHGCNVHEGAISRVQEGGTGVLTFGQLAEQFDHMNSGQDVTGLGRFSFSRYIGENGISTWVVCGYQPCKSKGPSTSYQQQRRYFIEKRQPDVKPRDKFFEDFIALLKRWRDEGDRIIVCLDANENIYTKRIGRALTEIDGLAMKEVVGDYTGKQLGATYFRGSQPIDGVWATKDIEVLNACVMPVGYGMGDHRCFVVDFSLSSLVGRSLVRVKKLKARRLNTKLPRVAERYNQLLEQNLIRHKVDDDHRTAYLAETKEEARLALASSEEKSKQYMAHAESKCRKIKAGRIPFSAESVTWIKRSEVYRTLLRHHAGRKVNRGNLKRKCKKLKILRPFNIPVVEIAARLKACDSKCDHFRKHGHHYRKKHLDRRLEVAKKKGDEAAEKRILAIIKGERDRRFWRKLNYNLGKRMGGSIRAVQVETDGGDVVEYDTKDTVEKAILENIH